ncbi:MAG: DUF4760 domain-containing protein [Pseudohaliea sp.]
MKEWLCAQLDQLPFWIGALAAVYAARNGVRAISSSKESTRISSTMELMRTLIVDEIFIDGHKLAANCGRRPEAFAKMGDPNSYTDLTPSQQEEVDRLKLYMSLWEAMAIGIENGAYDETIIKSSLRSICVSSYKLMSPFIQSVRKSNNLSGIEWEKLVEKWRV